MDVLRQVSQFLSDVNEATLSGAIDVVAVRGPDGVLRSTPFHVRFGKLQGVIKPKGKRVLLHVNGEPVIDWPMELGRAGEGRFVQRREHEGDNDRQPHAEPVSPLHGLPAPPTTTIEAESLELVGRGGSRVQVRPPWLRSDSCDSSGSARSWIWGWGDLPVRRQKAVGRELDDGVNATDRGGQYDGAGSDNCLELSRSDSDMSSTTTTTSAFSTNSLFDEEDQSHDSSSSALLPTAAQLNALSLKEGANALTFTVGHATVTATLYLLPLTCRMVVVNVDGAITRSNKLGQIVPVATGKDWSHSGVARLLSAVERNGYHVVYLTSRAIGQTAATREYLTNLTQSETRLPEGPVLLSPDRLFRCVKREFLALGSSSSSHGSSYEFKSRALRDICALFPGSHNQPFHAGFAHSDADVLALRAAGVSESRIFVTDAESNVGRLNRPATWTYDDIHGIVDVVFPPFHDETTMPGMHSDRADDRFNAVNFWRTPLPKV